MRACRSCGAANADTFRFCGSCGAGIDVVTCAACGAAAGVDQRFCGDCGATIIPGAVPTPATSADERKLATVLFADVVGFTSMAERTDPETVARTVDAAFRRLADVVVDHGGTVDKYMGDSMMAVFGVPVSHDDDAERAVAAGLAMREVGGDLAFSIGINTGEVMVTSLGDGGVTVIGDAVNVAARLEKIAAPGEVLVGRLTSQLAGERVVFRERQPVVLKGKRDPVEVCEAVAIRPSGERLRVEEAPLVGRDDDLAFARAQWTRCLRTRSPTVLLVTGDAGVGKTRLIDELLTGIAGTAHVVRASYPAYGGVGGPKVGAEIVRQLGSSGDPEVDARVRSLAGHLHPSLRDIDPAALQQEQMWALRKLLEVRAAEQPLLFAVDDAHRSSDRFLEGLAGLLARLEGVAAMVLLAGRSEPSAWLGRFPGASTVRLGNLGAADAAALASSLLGGPPLAAASAAMLVDRSGGNPLYLRELVAMVRARDGFTIVDGVNRLAGDLHLPPSVQAILATRLDALRPAEKAVIQHVAVLGDRASAAEMAALGPEATPEVLRSLVGLGLLRQHADETFGVVDPLLGEVAYEALPRHVRSSRHRQAAIAVAASDDAARHLEAAARLQPDDDALAATAAQALASAGLALVESPRQPEGLALLQRAVDLGHREPSDLLALALHYSIHNSFEEGLAVLEHVPEDTGRPDLDAERVHVAANLRARDTESLELYDEAGRRWRALGNIEKQAWAASNKGLALFNLGRMAEAQDSWFEAIPLFEQIHERGGLVSVYGMLALIRPDDPRVGQWLAEVLEFGEATGDRGRQLTSLVPLAWHDYFTCRLGGPDEVAHARGRAAQLTALARETGAEALVVHGLCLGSHLARTAGMVEEAAALAAEAAALVYPPDLGLAALVAATCFAADRDLSTAAAPELPPAPDPVRSMAFVIAGEALVLAGRFDEAVSGFHGRGEGPRMGALDDVLQCVSGSMPMLLGDGLAAAAAQLEVSVEAADRLGAVPSQRAARALLAEARWRLGDLTGAKSLLDQIVPGEEGGVATALVLRARAVTGDEAARDALRAECDRLAFPGLDLGVD